MESSVTSPGDRPTRCRPWRRIVILGATVLLAAVSALFGRGILAWWTRHMAARRLHAGAPTTAEQWLAWSARFDPSDGRTELMRAACFRHRYEKDAWNAAIESAERLGAPAEPIERERQLGRIQAGGMQDDLSQLGELLQAGVPPHDVCAAFVHGYLVRKDAARAEVVLRAWAADHPDCAHLAYKRGMYWHSLGEEEGDLTRRYECRARAEADFRNALAREPRHEMARQALADLLEESDRFEDALAEYAALAAALPTRESARLGVARMLRRLGALDRARAVIESLPSRDNLSADAAAELGQIELESGNLERAQKWLRRVDLDRTDSVDALRAAATALAVEGETTGAERVLARLNQAQREFARTEDLLARLSTGVVDPQAAEELKRLTSPEHDLPPSQPLGEVPPVASAADLYAQHCGGCHGDNGDGNGRGARHLYPRARDFRTGTFRLVSTVNGVAALDDIASVLQRGMPGTAMRAYDELSEAQHLVLAEEVLRLHREGVREQLIDDLREADDEIDADELDEAVAFCTTPDEPVSIPAIGPADPKAVARGWDLYFTLGCHNCHGDDGKGTWETPCYDEQGLPTPPRDLVHEPFKGGFEPESIYLRLFLGMPGTPHPAAGNVPEDQLVDLVQYCRSLSREPKRVLTNHQRAVEASRHAVAKNPGGSHAGSD